MPGKPERTEPVGLRVMVAGVLANPAAERPQDIPLELLVL